MVPKGWVLSCVGNACNIKNNLRLPISSDERSSMSGEFPYYGPTGILGYINEYRIDEEFALIGEDGDHFLKYKDKEMTLLIAGKSNVNNHAHIITNSVSCLASWFQSYFVHKDITSHLTRQGAKRYKLTKAGLEKLSILLPPIPEQRKIAQILSTWDKAITTTERLLTNHQQQKKALMQRLLTGKQRFAGFEGEWSQIFLGQVTDSFSGGTPSRSKSEYYGGNIPWIKSGEVNDRFISNVEESITQLGLDNSSAKIVPSNSILVAMYGATAGKVAINLINAAVNQAVLAIVPKENICLYFLFYFLEYQMDKTLRLVQGGQPNLNAGIIKDILIDLPCLAEQQKIASVLSAADAEITTMQNQLDNLKLQKKALMQQLLTGKRRVKVDSPALATQ